MRLSEFVLRYRLGEGEWHIFTFPGHEIQVGRDPDNQLIIDHREVSRHHLQIRFEEGGFTLTDLNSSNGTQLDGISLTPLIPTELRPGQMIQIGDFTLVLSRASEDGAQISRELLPFLLRFRFGAGTWQTFPMEPGEKILGRDPNNDFYLNDSEVSRRHARLQIAQGEFWLTDLGSTNGTQVGGITLEPDQPYRLQLGQTFSIGNFILQLDEPSRFYKPPPGLPDKDRTGLGSGVRMVSGADTALDAPMPIQALNLMSKERTTIGRASDNDIVLSHPSVSRYHAAIERSGTDFRIFDLSSAYGVYVNDQKIVNEANLKDWDQIRIGVAVFLLSGHDLQQQVIPGLKLEAKNINQQISPSLKLLHDISLTVNANELVALVGLKGSGKSALLKAFSGDQPASHGQILVNDVDFYQHYDMFRSDVGYVPDEEIVHAQLNSNMILTDATRLIMPSDDTKADRYSRVARVLENIDLATIQDVPVSELPDSQVKRVSLGLELLRGPRLLFLGGSTQGLDPGAEYEMVRLLRRLADQGRTIITITDSVQNLMLFDKVIILARGGFLAFYGAPEDALGFFNQYRSDLELSEKEIGFEDIYRILADGKCGSSQEWHERYLNSQVYFRVFGIDPSLAELQSSDVQQAIPRIEQVARPRPRFSSIKQFVMLFMRTLRVLLREKWTLATMLVLAPVFGLLDFIWGRDLYDPIYGDPNQIIVMWFFGGVAAILVGTLSSYREINKETGVFKHERWNHLKILPYFFSKLSIGIPLAMYQAGVLLVFRLYLGTPKIPTLTAFIAIYITFYLSILTGYLLGLLISALTSKPYQALSLIAVSVILQTLFAGALLPLDSIPGGRSISILMPARWSYEAFVRLTGLGDQLATDLCWIGYSKADRLVLTDEIKEKCACMGASIFTQCADFPGVFSPDFYDDKAALALSIPEPRKPLQPTEIPFPTPHPSPTSLPTPTRLPTLTPIPTPRASNGNSAYQEKVRSQNNEFQNLITEQLEKYQVESLAQKGNYYLAQAVQNQIHSDAQQAQAESYLGSVQTYQDTHTEWWENRQKAIRSAEAVISSAYDNHPQIFRGGVVERLIYLLVIQMGLALWILFVLKRKDRF